MAIHSHYKDIFRLKEELSWGIAFIFGWTIPLRPVHTKDNNYDDNDKYKVLIIMLILWE